MRSNLAIDTSDDFNGDDTDVVVVDTLIDFETEEVTRPIPLETMAELVGMAAVGPDRPTREMSPLRARRSTQPYTSTYTGRVTMVLS